MYYFPPINTHTYHPSINIATHLQIELEKYVCVPEGVNVLPVYSFDIVSNAYLQQN